MIIQQPVFLITPIFREAKEAFTHLDGKAYVQGEVITERPIETEAVLTQGVGITPTLIDENASTYDGEYLPLLAYPLRF